MKIALSVAFSLFAAVEARSQIALEDAQLRPTGAPLGGYYGEALAIHDTIAIVGEPGDDSVAPNAGVARVFRRAPSGAWNETQVLVPSLHGTGHEFGRAVAFDGATIAISAPGNERVFVFNDLGSGMFTEVDVLANPDPTTVGFGSLLDLELGLLATTSEFSAFGSSTPPSLHVFERNVATWNLSQSVPLVDATGAPFTPASLSLTLDAGLQRIAIGTREKLSLPSLVLTSSVHVYEATTSFNWSRTATLDLPGPHVGGAFGHDVAVHKTRLAVSRHAPAEAGRVFTFERASASSWTLTDEVLPPNSAIGDWFGIALDLEKDRLLVGAPGLPTGLPGGGAWLFERRSDATWAPSVRFSSSSSVQLGLTCDLSGPFGASPRAAVGSGNVATSARAVQAYDLGTLYHGTNTLSLSSGGTRGLFMRAGEARGGDAYVLLASLSGSQPGTIDPLTGFTIPINVDAYTLFFLQNGGGAILFPWVGLLDADGRADATYAVAPGTSASFVGLTVHHTFVAVDTTSLGISVIGNAVRVRLLP